MYDFTLYREKVNNFIRQTDRYVIIINQIERYSITPIVKITRENSIKQFIEK